MCEFVDCAFPVLSVMNEIYIRNIREYEISALKGFFVRVDCEIGEFAR